MQQMAAVSSVTKWDNFSQLSNALSCRTYVVDSCLPVQGLRAAASLIVQPPALFIAGTYRLVIVYCPLNVLLMLPFMPYPAFGPKFILNVTFHALPCFRAKVCHSREISVQLNLHTCIVDGIRSPMDDY